MKIYLLSLPINLDIKIPLYDPIYLPYRKSVYWKQVFDFTIYFLSCDDFGVNCNYFVRSFDIYKNYVFQRFTLFKQSILTRSFGVLFIFFYTSYHKFILLHPLLKWYVSDSAFYTILFLFSTEMFFFILLQSHREYDIDRFIVLVCANICLNFPFFNEKLWCFNFLIKCYKFISI